MDSSQLSHHPYSRAPFFILEIIVSFRTFIDSLEVEEKAAWVEAYTRFKTCPG